MSTRSQKSFTVRRADPKDGEGILACLASAFAPYRNKYTPAALKDTVLDSESVQRRLREMCVFVAVAQKRVVGTLACAASGEEAHLRGMAVLPDWQGCGVASALLEAAEVQVRNQHRKRVTLDTAEPLARAMRFYERHGFLDLDGSQSFRDAAARKWIKSL